MAWIGKEDLDELRDEHTAFQIQIAKLEAQLAAETNRRERVELEFARLNDDFRSLVALTAGRVPPKIAPQFDRDPFAEDETQSVTYLSPDPDDVGFDAAAMLRQLENEREDEAPLG